MHVFASASVTDCSYIAIRYRLVNIYFSPLNDREHTLFVKIVFCFSAFLAVIPVRLYLNLVLLLLSLQQLYITRKKLYSRISTIPKSFVKNWARLIQKIHNVDPLLCPNAWVWWILSALSRIKTSSKRYCGILACGRPETTILPPDRSHIFLNSPTMATILKFRLMIIGSNSPEFILQVTPEIYA